MQEQILRQQLGDSHIMKYGQKFNALYNALEENTSYRANAKGVEMIQTYHAIIANLEKALTPILEGITKDPVNMAKQAAIQIVSSINSSKAGNESFDIMARLDTLTNGGKTPIQGDSFAFNQDDKILNYLEKMQ
jgi:hypothetical protein